jgi:hypothetical protein
MRTILGVISGIIIGGLGVGSGAAAVTYFTYRSTGGGDWIGLSNSNVLAAIGAAWCAAIIGGIIGGIASSFGLPFPKSALFSFGLSLLTSFIFMLYIGEGPLRHNWLGYLLCSIVGFGTVFGTLGSRLNQTPDNSPLLPSFSSEMGGFFQKVAACVGNAHFWHWVVIVPIILWTLYFSLALGNYIYDLPRITAEKERIRKLQEERQKETGGQGGYRQIR